MAPRSLLGVSAACAAILATWTLDGRSAQAGKPPVTFTEAVAPIIFSHCAFCHRPGEEAPFPLLTYQDVRSRGRLIAAVTASRFMPPWKATSADFRYKNDRRLSNAEIETLQEWVSQGMPEGDPAKLPPIPEQATPGWPLGPPDLIVKMGRSFPVPATGPDVYRNFVLPLNLSEDTWVNAVDFRPSARTAVHHSLFLLDTTGTARRRDGRDGLPGYGGTMGIGTLADLIGGRDGFRQLLRRGNPGREGRPDQEGATSQSGAESIDLDRVGRRLSGIRSLGGWAMGAEPHTLPGDLAFLVPKGSDLVLSTHFHPSGKSEEEQSTIGLYFAAGPPTKRFMGIQLPPVFGVFEGIDIAPGEKHYTISDSYVLPVDVKAFLVGAHAHYLGREMKLTATFPDGTTKALLEIKDWDLAWQDQYQFEDFVPLPKGTRLNATISYDNSADNPRNPSHPPKRVYWGEQSTDEMASVGLQVVAEVEGELGTLRQNYREHVRHAFLTRPGVRMLLERFRPPPVR